MAGSFAGCGPPRWLVPSAQRSRRRGHHRCLSLLWLGPLSLLLAGCSDVVHWPPQLPGAWASASWTHPPAAFVALAGIALSDPLAHSARVVLSALLAHAILAPAPLALEFPASTPIPLALAALGRTRTAILVRFWGWEQIPPSAPFPTVRGPICPSRLQE